MAQQSLPGMPSAVGACARKGGFSPLPATVKKTVQIAFLVR